VPSQTDPKTFQHTLSNTVLPTNTLQQTRFRQPIHPTKKNIPTKIPRQTDFCLSRRPYSRFGMARSNTITARIPRRIQINLSSRTDKSVQSKDMLCEKQTHPRKCFLKLIHTSAKTKYVPWN